MMKYIFINMWPTEIKNDSHIKFINVNPSPDEINAFNHLLDKCVGFHRYERTGMSLGYYIKNIYTLKKKDLPTNCVLNLILGYETCVTSFRLALLVLTTRDTF